MGFNSIISPFCCTVVVTGTDDAIAIAATAAFILSLTHSLTLSINIYTHFYDSFLSERGGGLVTVPCAVTFYVLLLCAKSYCHKKKKKKLNIDSNNNAE